jgi:hypothetical protein
MYRALRRISYAVIIISWAAIMSMLVMKQYGWNWQMQRSHQTSALPDVLYESQWFGVYYNEKKIGYASRKINRTENGYNVSELLKLQLHIMNSEKKVETVTDAYLDSAFNLLSFDLALKSDVNMNIRGRMDGERLIVSLEALGSKSEKTLYMKEKPSLNLSLIPNILKNGISPGGKYHIPIVDPATLSQARIIVEITGREDITVMGKSHNAYKLKGTFHGSEFLIWITEDGRVLREESTMGFTLVKEDRDSALRPGNPSLDIIAQVAVPSNLDLPPYTNYLKVRISNINLKGLEIHGGRQKLSGNVLEVWREMPRTFAKTQKPPQTDQYLSETTFVQSRDPRIVSLSRDIVGEEDDKIKSAELIYQWVYKNIEKEPAITVPLATEVIRIKKGDCNEHATLFTALSRAAGIPTRIAVGLAYKEGFFYYHAWPEFFADQWIAVDPTLGQFPADASHIRLLTGDLDRQMQILPVIGKIKIDGLEHR